MVKVAGIQFEKNGKMYTFDAEGFDIRAGDYVIVQTSQGIDLGEVVMGCREIEEEKAPAQMRKILRIATNEDIQLSARNREKEREAYTICQHKISEHKLEMKLVSVEYAFDGSKILFYFTANGRIDFRSLVKDLASVFRTRIELRQIGVRDEARMLGGLGPCGRSICCGTFLADFEPVSIKMAKEQNLSLNPSKISGVCGRLMCCLKYEQDHYEQTRRRMPRVGREIQTPEGPGYVTDLNIVKETVSVRITKGDTSEVKVFSLEELGNVGHPGAAPQKSERMAELEAWEAEEAALGNAYDEAEDDPVEEPPAPDQPPEGIPENGPAPRRPRRERENAAAPRPRKGAPKPRGAGRADEREKEPDREAAPQARPGAAPRKDRRDSAHPLGQPVKRENPKKAGPKPGPSASAAPASAKTGTQAGKWAEQLERAMQAVDQNTAH